MYVCMYVCNVLRKYVCMYVLRKYDYVCMYVCENMYVCMYVYVCIYAYMYVCMHVCIFCLDFIVRPTQLYV